MRIALAQMFCDWGNVKGNLKRTEKFIHKAALKNADLVIFPEMSVHGMWKNHLVRLAAEPLNGPIVKKVSAWAKKYHIAVGFGLAEKTKAKPYNCYVLLDKNGRKLGAYRKNFITVLEKPYFRPDKLRPVFKLAGARIGISICADSHCTDILKGYGRRGVDLVLLPHAWDADPILKGGKIAVWKSEEHMVDCFVKNKVLRYRTHNEMLKFFTEALGAKIVRGGFCAAFVNPVGQSHRLIPFVGPAFVMDKNGKIIAKSKYKKETLLTADLPIV